MLLLLPLPSRLLYQFLLELQLLPRSLVPVLHPSKNTMKFQTQNKENLNYIIFDAFRNSDFLVASFGLVLVYFLFRLFLYITRFFTALILNVIVKCFMHFVPAVMQKRASTYFTFVFSLFFYRS